ncbi:unnamed protein product, partial [Laminaria digitata]
PEGEEEVEVTETTDIADYQLVRALDLLKGIATYTVRATN